jgi:predicted Zn-dependent peptidase
MAFALDGIDETALRLEKKIVRNELAERSGNLPWRMLMQRRRSLYGAEQVFAGADDAEYDAVDAVTLTGVQWFFQSSYRPDNATLVLVGAFDPDTVRPLIERYFGTIQNPKLPRRAFSLPSPKPCGEHRVELGHHFLLGRFLTWTWTFPPPATPTEHATLVALARVLESTLGGALVNRRLDVADVSVDLELLRTHALLNVELALLEFADFAGIEARVDKLVAELVSKPKSDKALAGLRATLKASAVRESDSNVRRALSIARGVDPARYAEGLAAIDAASLHRAAQSLKGAHLVLTVRSDPDASHGIEILHEVDPCR